MAVESGGIGHFARRWGLLVVVALLLLALFPALAPAQTAATVSVTGGSWYWFEQVGTVAPPAGTPLPPVAPPGALPTPDVPAGDFPVSVVGGQADKESFLQIDTSAIPQGSTVPSLVLTLHEDPAAQGNLNTSSATIEARAVTGYMAGGAQGAPWANRPSYDTTGPAAAGKRSANGTWTFELGPIASNWANGTLANSGLAIVPVTPQQGQSYEVVTGAVGTPLGPSVAGSFMPPAPGTPEAAAAGVESVPSDQSAGPVSIAPDTSGAGLSTTASPSVGSVPSAAAPSAAPSNRPTVARNISSSHRAPPWGFYLVVVVLIALIGASTLSLGDFGEPEPERQGGVLRTLERRSAPWTEVST